MIDRIVRIEMLLSKLRTALDDKDAHTSLFMCGGLDQQVDWLIKDIKDWADHEIKPSKDVS